LNSEHFLYPSEPAVTVTSPTATDLLDLFPPGATRAEDGTIVVGGCRLDEIAERYGTPAYVVDEGSLRARARELREELARVWPRSRVAFASKSFPAKAMYRLAADEGLKIDVAGGGELVLALAAGADAHDIVLHGNAKSDAEMLMAVEARIGTVVVDNSDDVDRLEHLLGREPAGREPQGVLVRVVPGIDADTHAAMATGGDSSKFGLPVDQALALIDRIRASRGLRMDGVHVHVGSQILDVDTLARAVEVVAGLGTFDVYDLGGGLGVRYTVEESAPSVAEYADALGAACRAHLPADASIVIEPGRSLVARSGVTLYRVVTVKRGTDRTFVAVDGGMGDNLEVSLYQQRFTATVVDRVGGGEPYDLVGHHCESGDRLIEGVHLDAPRVGDLVVLPVTGAYCYTMANNYNGALRPPVVFCHDGTAREVVRRETYEDLLARQIG
jgi:diaminopimelate decarboxylase